MAQNWWESSKPVNWWEESTPVSGASPEPLPGQRQAGPVAQVGRATASLADVALGAIPGTIQQATFPVVRMFTSPERAQEISQTVSEPFARPFGKAFGVTQTPEYQAEPSRQLMNFVGANIDKGINWLSSKTGLPKEDVANMVSWGMTAAPYAAPAIKEVRNALLGPPKPKEPVPGVAEQLAGNVTGKPAQAYSEAFKAGKTGDRSFLENLRGQMTPDDLLTTVKQNIEQIRDANAQAYTTAKTGWAANTNPLDFQPIDQAFNRITQSLQSRGKWTIGDAERRIVDQIGTVLDEWRADPTARTALDFDALKRRIDAIYPESPQHTQAQRAVTAVRDAVKNEIVRNTPEYADAMKSYEVQMNLLRDINKGLSTGDKVAKETTITKLMGALKSGPSADIRRQLVTALQEQGGAPVMPGLAGQTLSPWMPGSGIGKSMMAGGLTTAVAYRHPELTAILPLTSPRLMGEAFYTAGRASNALGSISPEAKAYTNALMIRAQQENALAR